MQFLKRLNKDRIGAALILALGIAVTVQGSSYRVGELTRMGAGYMPVVYGVLLTAVGLLMALTAKREPDEAGPPSEWRGWLCIVGGVCAFVLLGRHGGLAPATFSAVFVSAMGDRSNSPRDAALLGLLMVAAAYFIFVLGLRMQFPLFAWGD